MSVPRLVERFYESIWNAGDLEAIAGLLAEDFSFRGSLGVERRGREAFKDYVCAIRNALGDYRCAILECVTEGSQAFAKMHFSGIHVGEFRGYLPTGMSVHWAGAALFRFGGNTIADLWVLGDLESLDAMLEKNRSIRPNVSDSL